ncbi:hypothetical protein [Halospeciosus flavus]|uniref:hypothetical protein n=1 Tax=Halospeciosus flavus TaxID=3032283 RepID=UPI0036D33F21
MGRDARVEGDRRDAVTVAVEQEGGLWRDLRPSGERPVERQRECGPDVGEDP